MTADQASLALALWAIVAIPTALLCTDRHTGDWDDERETIDPMGFVAAAAWPIIPAAAAFLLLAFPLLLVFEWTPRAIAKWWASDWSQGAHHG